MAGTVAFRGGSGQGNFHAYNDYDNVYIYDSVSYPSGNRNRAGSVVVGISAASVVDGVGITAIVVSSNGYVYVYCGTPRLEFDRASGAGGSIGLSNGAASWAGGLCGQFTWYTVPSKPASISLVRTGRNVEVTVGTSSDNGGYSIDGYYVRARKNGGAWGAEVLAVAGIVNFTNLDASATYDFDVSAHSAAGYSEGRVSSTIFIPAGGKRQDSLGDYNATTIAKRKNSSGVWVDIATAKRQDASDDWVELGA